MNNNTTTTALNDPLTELLSLPVNFTVDPLVTNEKPFVSLKKSRLSLDDKDQKTKERILRNRAAAQESRDKKRKYVSELETNNRRLSEENERMNKKLKQLEEQNAILQSNLAIFTKQLTSLQNQIKPNTTLLLNNFCDSARIAKKMLSCL